MFRRILVAIDDLENCHPLVAQAAGLARLTTANLLLLHVALSERDQPNRSIFLADGGYLDVSLYTTSQTYERNCQTDRQQWLAKLQSLADAIAETELEVDIVEEVGIPGPLIVHTAAVWDADLIVLRRGLTPIKELMLGSVSNYVLHHACCAVLLLQGQSSVKARASRTMISTTTQ